MADLIVKNTSGRSGRKENPRIDLTPMVDLGFLLITFFIFTTSLSEPKTMDINMPAEGEPTEVAHHTAMTIFLHKQHKLFYFSGMDAMQSDFGKLKETRFNTSGIRQVLLTHITNVNKARQSGLPGSKAGDQPFVLIKAGNLSDYSDLVNLLDELKITGIEKYALVDMTAPETAAMNQRN